MLLIEFEKLHDVAKTFNLVFKTLVYQNVYIKLFVAPVNLKNRLEAS